MKFIEWIEFVFAYCPIDKAHELDVSHSPHNLLCAFASTTEEDKEAENADKETTGEWENDEKEEIPPIAKFMQLTSS